MTGRIVCIVGQTATGKTDLALGLASAIPFVLISADSRQVYKEMDIGTGKDKPSNEVLVQLQDEVFPNEEWSVSHFVRTAEPFIEYAWDAKKLPIIVGGTGMYCDALIGKYESIHIHQNPTLRVELEHLTKEQLQAKLQLLRPERFNHMNNSDRNNPRRLVRAIEVASEMATPPLSTMVRERNVCWIGLTLPQDILEKRIAERVQKRFTQGMIKETKALMEKYKDWTSPAFSATGYREVRAYIEEKISKEQCIKTWTLHELQYAKRQLTWFKKNPRVQWFDAQDQHLRTKVENIVRSWYDKLYATH